MRFFRTSPEKLPAAESEMIFSKQDLKQLLLPLLAEQFLVVLIGMMDTIMVSYCGMKAMSGVSLVDGINVLLIGVFSALATGGAVLVSQYLGKKRPDAAKTAAKMLVLRRFARFAGDYGDLPDFPQAAAADPLRQCRG